MTAEYITVPHEGHLKRALGLPSLVAFSVVNLSVIKHYFVDMRERNILLNLIAPTIGFLLTAWLWTSLSGTALTIGLIWLAIGFLWLLGVTRGFRRPTPVVDLEYERCVPGLPRPGVTASGLSPAETT